MINYGDMHTAPADVLDGKFIQPVRLPRRRLYHAAP